LKERGFKPRRKCRKINIGFSRWGSFSTQQSLFPQPVLSRALPGFV